MQFWVKVALFKGWNIATVNPSFEPWQLKLWLLSHKKRSDTAQNMAYSDWCRLSQKVETVKTVRDYQDSSILSRQLHTVKTVTAFQGSFRLVQNIKKREDSYRPLQTCLFLSVYWELSLSVLKGGAITMAYLSGKRPY